ncbi:MAG: hypothetical protein JSU70_06400, partial [Phycisphaerales bacterium]
EQPQAWLSAITFLNSKESPFPDHFVSHIANNMDSPLKLESFRLWLPANRSTWRALLPQKWISAFEAFPPDRIIPPGDRGAAIVSTGFLPLTYTVLEVRLRDPKNDPVTLWAHLRIKREVFDISGGWVSSKLNGRSTLTFEPYLKTLRSMHIDTAHIGEVAGYTDNPQLYSRYPLKRFNKLADFDRYDTDTMLEQIHAVEFLGEPQYGADVQYTRWTCGGSWRLISQPDWPPQLRTVKNGYGGSTRDFQTTPTTMPTAFVLRRRIPGVCTSVGEATAFAGVLPSRQSGT